MTLWAVTPAHCCDISTNPAVGNVVGAGEVTGACGPLFKTGVEVAPALTTVAAKPKFWMDESAVNAIVMLLPLDAIVLGKLSPVSDCRRRELVEGPS
jgi:hypothetical protein